jgi:hypothetical protein
MIDMMVIGNITYLDWTLFSNADAKALEPILYRWKRDSSGDVRHGSDAAAEKQQREGETTQHLRHHGQQ